MSSLRDKLNRLARAAEKRGPTTDAGRVDEREHPGAQAGEHPLDRAAAASSVADGAGAGPAPESEADAPRALAELARQLVHAVGSSAPSHAAERSRARNPLGLDALGFVHTESNGWVRRRAVPLDEHIGQAPLGPAATADAHMLGLLGLTPVLSACQPRGALYLDTETTGLGGAGTLAFLVGMAWLDDRAPCFTLEQWLLSSPAHEPALLDAVRRRLDASQFVVSYNGRAFDLPLLRSRFVMNAKDPMADRPQLDLLHLVRRVHRHRRWRKTLGGVERHVLDFDRGPDIAGADVAQIYHHYLRSQDAAAIEPVVRHNEHDVLAMVALVGLYGEPLERLAADDLASLARTLRRAGDVERAASVAAEAVRRGGGTGALRVRAEIAKARGDKGLALRDFERLASEVDDPTVRLELAKLYEHHVRDPIRALAVTMGGTGEEDAALDRRTSRLERKIAGAARPALKPGPKR